MALVELRSSPRTGRGGHISRRQHAHAPRFAPHPPEAALARGAAGQAARRLNRASGVVALSVLVDSAIEHYRGSFHNKAMITPLVWAALSLAAGLYGSSGRRPKAHPVRDAAYAATGLVALIGTGFHVYNIGKRPGGFSLQNLFYGAPAALMISGMLGFLAERTRDNAPGAPPSNEIVRRANSRRPGARVHHPGDALRRRAATSSRAYRA